MTCVTCKEWFEVWTNVGGPGLVFCPCCGHQFTDSEHEDMVLADDDGEDFEAEIDP